MTPHCAEMELIMCMSCALFCPSLPPTLLQQPLQRTPLELESAMTVEIIADINQSIIQKHMYIGYRVMCHK